MNAAKEDVLISDQNMTSSDITDPPTTSNKDDLGDMTFCMSNYAKEALKMMYMMRQHHMLTDVVLEVEQELFHVHKVVLSSASPYFKAMFTGGLKESEMSRVKLQGVSLISSMGITILRFNDYFPGLSNVNFTNYFIHVYWKNSCYRSHRLSASSCSNNVSSSQCDRSMLCFPRTSIGSHQCHWYC